MSSLFSTGTSALLGYQRSLATIGNNVANATTPGYSRQVTQLSTLSTDGVEVQDVKRMTDSLATTRVRNSTGELNRLEQLSTLSGDVDKQLSDNSSNLTTPWSNFFDALSGLSSDPTSTAYRQATLQNADSLATRFRQLDSSLDGVDQQCNDALQASAEQVNALTSQIAKLNRQISQSSPPALEAMDKRDLMIEQLIGFTGGSAISMDDGSVNVFTQGGQPLVVGTTAMSLEAVDDPYRPGRSNLALRTGDQITTLGEGVLGGSIGGVIEFRSNVLDPSINELGRLSVALAEGINNAQAAGVDSNGNRGENLFSLTAPAVNAHRSNSGNASVQASVTDIGQLKGSNVLLRYENGSWSAIRSDSGAQVALTGTGTSTDPLQVDGISLVVSGTAADGDRFELRPTGGAAGSLRVIISDPSQIAAARAVQGSADISNIGNATVQHLHVTDPDNAALTRGATIEFTDTDQYTITSNGVESGPFAYTPGSTIAADGWSFVLDGAVAAGDVFNITATGAGSSDNGNMLLMAGLEDSKLLDGGTLGLNSALAGLTSTVATASAQSNYAYDAEQVIHNDAVAARDSISGVNLDEEAADLIKYQQAYQAAARIIASADEVFQTLLQAV